MAFREQLNYCKFNYVGTQIANAVSDMVYLLSISTKPWELYALIDSENALFSYQLIHLHLEGTAVYLSLPYFRAMTIFFFSVIM